MKNIKGSNLVEYAIPLALVGLVVGLGLYSIYSGGYLKNFFAASGNLKIDESTGKASLGTPANDSSPLLNSPGSLGGTSDAPVKECEKGTCTVDFGEFILTGIPDNFSEFVESQGNSGGTDQLATVFEQLAEQLLEDGDEEGYQQYLDMANLCHYLAKLQKNLEDGRDRCMKDPDGSWCFSEALRNYRSDMLENDTTVPDFLKQNPELFALGDPGMFSNFFSQGGTRIDLARADIESGKISTDPPYNKLTTAIVSMYDNIMDNPKYSDNLKGITKVLYQEIDKITYDQYIKSQSFAYAMIQGGLSMTEAKSIKYDPISGDAVETITYYDAHWNPQASTETDLDSAMICVAGNNSDTGQECK